MSQSRQKEIAQEKREHGLEIAPAANQQTREERAQGRQDQERGREGMKSLDKGEMNCRLRSK